VTPIPPMPKPGEPVPDPAIWFEQMYGAAEQGELVIPWDRGAPAPLLVQWLEQHPGIDGAGQRALVIGCGQGDDAAFIASRGFRTVAFDVSESAIRAAKHRYPDAPVQWEVADVLRPPAAWSGAFDFVFESRNAQAMPEPPRSMAIRNIGLLVAPGGTLLVIAAARDDDEPDDAGPPWPLPRATIEGFATEENGLGLVEMVRDDLGAGGPEKTYWRAEFRRPF